jgi:hypothetical protein
MNLSSRRALSWFSLPKAAAIDAMSATIVGLSSIHCLVDGSQSLGLSAKQDESTIWTTANTDRRMWLLITDPQIQAIIFSDIQMCKEVRWKC